jgi:hypothetical protein
VLSSLLDGDGVGRAEFAQTWIDIHTYCKNQLEQRENGGESENIGRMATSQHPCNGFFSRETVMVDEVVRSADITANVQEGTSQ